MKSQPSDQAIHHTFPILRDFHHSIMLSLHINRRIVDDKINGLNHTPRAHIPSVPHRVLAAYTPRVESVKACMFLQNQNLSVDIPIFLDLSSFRVRYRK